MYAPTFSPDGTQIAYVAGGGDHSHHVWVMDADGSDAHEIVFNETDGRGRSRERPRVVAGWRSHRARLRL